MFIARLPLQLTVRASVENNVLDFSEGPVHLLVRYERFTITENDEVIETRPDILPEIREPDQNSPWEFPANGNPWSIVAINTNAADLTKEAVLTLGFDPVKMNALVASSGGQHPLYLAFLDQGTIELQFVMRAFEPNQSPCEGDEYRVGALFLKLCVLPTP